MSLRCYAWVERNGKLAFKGGLAAARGYYLSRYKLAAQMGEPLTLAYCHSAEDRERHIAELDR